MIPSNILLNNWESDWVAERKEIDYLLTEAYQAGADAELEACCEWLKSKGWDGCGYEHEALFAARRPNPSRLKEQALKEMDKLDAMWDVTSIELDSLDIIRKALEALPDDL